MLSFSSVSLAKDKKVNLPDSGERSTYSTGAQRDNQIGRGRYDLISPYALKDLAVRLELGALKYSERNWEKGMNAGRYANAIYRHLNQLIMGDDAEDHIGAILFNAMALSHTRAMIKKGIYPEDFWDFPEYEKEVISEG